MTAVLLLITTVYMIGSCLAEDFPLCCGGGRSLKELLSTYVRQDFEKSIGGEQRAEVCDKMRKDVEDMSRVLTVIDCVSTNGGKQLISTINSKVGSQEDKCAKDLSFIRALFELGRISCKDADVSDKFDAQIKSIDATAKKFGLPISKVQFNAPTKDHEQKKQARKTKAAKKDDYFISSRKSRKYETAHRESSSAYEDEETRSGSVRGSKKYRKSSESSEENDSDISSSRKSGRKLGTLKAVGSPKKETRTRDAVRLPKRGTRRASSDSSDDAQEFRFISRRSRLSPKGASGSDSAKKSKRKNKIDEEEEKAEKKVRRALTPHPMKRKPADDDHDEDDAEELDESHDDEQDD